MTCPEVREYLFAFLDSELDAALSIELQRHLERCAACAREVEIERAIRRRLAKRIEAAFPARPFDDAALCRTLVAGVSRRRWRLAPALRRRAAALTSVAALVVISLAAWLPSRMAETRPGAGQFTDWVIADFEHFVREGQPLQLASSDPKAVSGWLLENTGIHMDMPPADSPGHRLIGARQCSIGGKPAAFAMFRLGGVPASVVATAASGIDVSRMTRVEHAGRAHWVGRCRGHTVVACRGGGSLVAAVSTLPERELLNLITDMAHEGD
ncbi:MAG: anti-sigma factor family protein [Phycisphaerae bacterium]